MSVRSPSSRRRWIFRSLAIAIGLLPFVAAEMLLRWLDPAAEPVAEAIDRDPLVDLHQLQPLFVPSADGTRWEIPPERSNFFQPASFARPKPPNTMRAFVVGGSTVQGRPYATETAFPAFLAIHLQHAHPEMNFEVVNCGGVSYASYRVAAIVDEVLHHAPDLVIVYTGHNEFLEDRTYADWRSIPRPLAPIIAAGFRLRLVQEAAKAIKDPHRPTVMPSEVATRLDEVHGLDAFERDEAWRESVHQHFDSTLRRIVQRCQSAGVPLWLCVPASDVVETPPFKVEPDPELPPAQQQQIAVAWQQVMEDEGASDEVRLELCRSILRVDPHHAGAAYVLGRNRWQHNDIERARRWLRVARDWDVCPLRATSTIKQTVRDVAADFETGILDVPVLFDQRKGDEVAISVDGIPDPSWFVDHVHPSVAGHQRIAEALYEQINSRTHLLPKIDRGTSDERNATLAARREAVHAHLQTLDESYFHRGKQRLEGLRRWAAGRAGNTPPAARRN